MQTRLLETEETRRTLREQDNLSDQQISRLADFMERNNYIIALHTGDPNSPSQVGWDSRRRGTDGLWLLYGKMRETLDSFNVTKMQVRTFTCIEPDLFDETMRMLDACIAQTRLVSPAARERAAIYELERMRWIMSEFRARMKNMPRDPVLDSPDANIVAASP